MSDEVILGFVLSSPRMRGARELSGGANALPLFCFGLG
jgi:hypothetical protein